MYAGYDYREEVGYHTFCSSVIAHTRDEVSICPLRGQQRDGTNAFTYARFLIPFMQGFRGFAIFADGSDMTLKADIADLWSQFSLNHAVQVVKHDYKTKHPRKYVGTSMEAANEDYPRKNWSSVMLINCSHYAWRDITPERVERMTGAELHRFSFIPDKYIGELPAEWNWLADEYGENPNAKLLHWTAGIPAFPHYAHSPHADDWFRAEEKVSQCASLG